MPTGRPVRRPSNGKKTITSNQEDHSSGAAQEQWKYKKQGVEQRLDKIDDQKDAAKEELKHRWNDD